MKCRRRDAVHPVVILRSNPPLASVPGPVGAQRQKDAEHEHASDIGITAHAKEGRGANLETQGQVPAQCGRQPGSVAEKQGDCDRRVQDEDQDFGDQASAREHVKRRVDPASIDREQGCQRNYAGIRVVVGQVLKTIG